ncbi:MAG: sulfur carrier protein ThiS [Thermodesulfobacteriota bacterium]
MLLRVNGEDREFEGEGGLTVEVLLKSLDIETRGTAVELNCEVVPKSRHSLTPLNEGDSIEIIRMTGGG